MTNEKDKEAGLSGCLIVCALNFLIFFVMAVIAAVPIGAIVYAFMILAERAK